MKKNINFSKGFLPCAIISLAIIVFGVVVSKPSAFFSLIANVRTNADVAASYAAPERN